MISSWFLNRCIFVRCSGDALVWCSLGRASSRASTSPPRVEIQTPLESPTAHKASQLMHFVNERFDRQSDCRRWISTFVHRLHDVSKSRVQHLYGDKLLCSWQRIAYKCAMHCQFTPLESWKISAAQIIHLCSLLVQSSQLWILRKMFLLVSISLPLEYDMRDFFTKACWHLCSQAV